MKLRYTPEVICDLELIQDYIANRLINPTAAQGIIQNIAIACHRRKEQPRMGIEVRKKTGREIDGYCMVSGAYMIIYDVDEAVSIIRILDARVDYMRILFGEAGMDLPGSRV